MTSKEYLSPTDVQYNTRIGLVAGQEARKRLSELARQAYQQSPKICATCGTTIPYRQRSNSFCNRRCATIHTNRTRPRAVRMKMTEAMVLARSLKPSHLRSPKAEYTRVYPKKCACGCLFFSKAPKTIMCPLCKTSKCIKNGIRSKHITYKGIRLDSSWELIVARKMDEKNIPWTRPSYITYEDARGRPKKYFPDFYLPEQDVYLDPKNPYRMQVDEQKMTAVSEKVTVIYGHLDRIMAWLEGVEPT